VTVPSAFPVRRDLSFEGRLPDCEWYVEVVKTKIDKDGRVARQAAIRKRADLSAGSELEVTADEAGIRLERVAAGPRIVRVGGRLVARPTVGANSLPVIIDIAALIEDERNRWR